MRRMSKSTKMSIVHHDPTLVDFLLEHKIAQSILESFAQLGSRKPEGWVKVPDVLEALEQIDEHRKLRNLRSTVHYYCKRLYEKYEAIDRHKSNRPVYYRIIDKGKTHLTKILNNKKEGEG